MRYPRYEGSMHSSTALSVSRNANTRKLKSTNGKRASQRESNRKGELSECSSRDSRANRKQSFRPRCRQLSQLPRSDINMYLNRSVSNSSAKSRKPSEEGNETHMDASLKYYKPRHVRSHSLPLTDSYEDIFTVGQCGEDYYYRDRSNSLPVRAVCKSQLSDQYSTKERTMSGRKMLAIMTNLAHIIIGIGITQLGIVGTWYQRYMNFPKDQLRYVLYICVIFIILGVYGMCVVMKKLENSKAYRTAYIILSCFSILACSFIIGNGIRLLLSETYKTNEAVIVIFDGLMIGLSGLEIPAVFVGLFVTVPKSSKLKYSPSMDQSLDNISYESTKSKPAPSWGSIFSIILNVAHIVLGLCITELGMVGMMYRSFMNIDSTGLFSIVFISLSFVSVGMIGIYNQMTDRASISCNRSMYTCASLLAIGCATMIMTFVSIAMSSKTYYSGIEAIVAFDVMILSMSGMELIVGIAATAICLVPILLSRLKKKP